MDAHVYGGPIPRISIEDWLAGWEQLLRWPAAIHPGRVLRRAQVRLGRKRIRKGSPSLPVADDSVVVPRWLGGAKSLHQQTLVG